MGSRAYDCARRPKRCLLVVAGASDFDRSGGRALTFRSGLPEVPLVPRPFRSKTDKLAVAGAPTGLVAAGTPITVIARGFVPGEPVLLAWCTNRFELTGPEGACEPEDPGAALYALVFRSTQEVKLHADDAGVVVATLTARADIDPVDSWTGLLANEATASPGTSSPSTTSSHATQETPLPSWDCTDRPGRCAIVVAAAADTKRSAVLPYEVRD